MTDNDDSTRRRDRYVVRLPPELAAEADELVKVLENNRRLIPGWRLSRTAVLHVAMTYGLAELRRRLLRGEKL